MRWCKSSVPKVFMKNLQWIGRTRSYFSLDSRGRRCYFRACINTWQGSWQGDCGRGDHLGGSHTHLLGFRRLNIHTCWHYHRYFIAWWWCQGCHGYWCPCIQRSPWACWGKKIDVCIQERWTQHGDGYVKEYFIVIKPAVGMLTSWE